MAESKAIENETQELKDARGRLDKKIDTRNANAAKINELVGMLERLGTNGAPKITIDAERAKKIGNITFPEGDGKYRVEALREALRDLRTENADLTRQIDQESKDLERRMILASNSQELYLKIEAANDAVKIAGVVREFQYNSSNLSDYQKGHIRAAIEAKILEFIKTAPATNLAELQKVGVPAEYLGNFEQVTGSEEFKKLLDGINNSTIDFSASIRDWVLALNSADDKNRKAIDESLRTRIIKEGRSKLSDEKGFKALIEQLKSAGLSESYWKDIQAEFDQVQAEGADAGLSKKIQKLAGLNNAPAFIKEVRPIWSDISSKKDNEAFVSQLRTKLTDLYKALTTDADREAFLKNAQDADIAGVLLEGVVDLEKKRKEKKTSSEFELVGNDIDALNVDAIATSPDIFTSDVIALWGRCKDNKELKDKLKSKVQHAYHTRLDDPIRRSDFVNRATRKGAPAELIGEYLWEETYKKVDAVKGIVDRLAPVMRDYIEPLNPVQANMVFSVQVRPKLLQESRAGIPLEAERDLRKMFEDACEAALKSDENGLIINDIVNEAADLISLHMLEGAGIVGAGQEFPFPTSTGGGPVISVAAVPNGNIDFGILRTELATAIDTSLTGGVDNARKEILIDHAYKRLLERVREEIPEVREVIKLRQEADKYTNKIKQLRSDRNWEIFNKVVGGIGAVGFFGPILYAIPWGSTPILGQLVNEIWTSEKPEAQIFRGVTGIYGIAGALGVAWANLRNGYQNKNVEIAAYEEKRKEKQVEYELKAQNIAILRETKLAQHKSEWEATARTVLAPRLIDGRQALESTASFLRRQINGAGAPELPRMAV